jgi:hypothetical protein
VSFKSCHEIYLKSFIIGNTIAPGSRKHSAENSKIRHSCEGIFNNNNNSQYNTNSHGNNNNKLNKKLASGNIEQSMNENNPTQSSGPVNSILSNNNTFNKGGITSNVENMNSAKKLSHGQQNMTQQLNQIPSQTTCTSSSGGRPPTQLCGSLKDESYNNRITENLIKMMLSKDEVETLKDENKNIMSNVNF